MDLFSPKTIKSLLAKYSAAPLKRMGQNFLINRGILQKIMEAANLDRGGTVLEIGPGLGSLTQELAGRAKKVIAVEKDKKFIEILKETLENYKNVEIINADILKLRNSEIKKLGNYKLVANLPYYITSLVIRKFLEEKNKPEEMLLMVQKEVAQRICASPIRSSAKRGEGGQTARMSLLAVSVQFYADPQIIGFVSKGSFWPPPKVDSAILKITPKTQTSPELSSAEFFTVVRAGFSAPRKQLAGNLAKMLKTERHIIEESLKKSGIEPSRRAETLNVEEWIKLTDQLA
jgi:16S rRNA (adenine1518-N6/adenine1519-N6)-dimethyltransferase